MCRRPSRPRTHKLHAKSEWQIATDKYVALTDHLNELVDTLGAGDSGRYQWFQAMDSLAACTWLATLSMNYE